MKKKIFIIAIALILLIFFITFLKLLYIPNYLKDSPSGSSIYVNNIKYDIQPKIEKSSDIKVSSPTKNGTLLNNISDNYIVQFPGEFDFDFSHSKDYIVAKNDMWQINISQDRSPYEDTFWYIDYYQNRFYLDENYLSANNITKHEYRTDEINGNTVSILTITKHYENREDVTYTYAFIQTNGQYYTRFMFKSNFEFNESYINDYTNVLKSYKETSEKNFIDTLAYYTNKVSKKVLKIDDLFARTNSANSLSLYPIANKNWNNNTKELYESFRTSNAIKWGIFTENITTTAIDEKIPELENKLDYTFDIILLYNHLGNALPLEAMQKMRDKNKIIELTVQTCANNNEKLFDYTPMFDIIEGKKDDEIKTLANEIKAFGNPVLFRLNNEMNSDWTSYSGIITLSDPEIYIEVWHRIYNIFEEEGVTNCIWIFNPNDNNYPPSKWNNFLSYYPGNEYVHMIGITGYNQGTYYEKYNDKWKTFQNIYDDIYYKYREIFKDLPWIITEFASSSIGGNKAKWIDDMFYHLPNYKNIKAAVWFSAADYDPDNPGTVSRPYWLDETEETLEAFKKGLHK